MFDTVQRANTRFDRIYVETDGGGSSSQPKREQPKWTGFLHLLTEKVTASASALRDKLRTQNIARDDT